jgi:hypothetical protein
MSTVSNQFERAFFLLPVLGQFLPAVKFVVDGARSRYSHSIVAGGLLEMSKQTRLTPLTSLMMRLESFSSSS